MQAQNASPKCQNASPKQFDPYDGGVYDFSADQTNDQEQIETLNEFIKGLQQAINQKNELLAAKEELLRSKDETIVMQKDALRLLESQINAVTGLVEKLTEYMGTDTKKRPERADARNASDVVTLDGAFSELALHTRERRPQGQVIVVF